MGAGGSRRAPAVLAAVCWMAAQAGYAAEIAPERAVQTVQEAQIAVAERQGIEPLYVRQILPAASGRNDLNPQWSPSGMFLTFERSNGDRRDIRIALADGTVFQTLYHLLGGDTGEARFLFPGVVEETSYNAALSWAPGEDRFVFMSNGGEGNYDLYLGEPGASAVTRLTEHHEKDGQPHWAPAGGGIVFTSGRTGRGDLYVIDPSSKALTRLTPGDREYLYPQWSPDGAKVAVTGGTSENHDIFLIDGPGKRSAEPRRLTAWDFDDLRPVWSPDGRRIAFYSNFAPEGEQRSWCIMVVDADAAGPLSEQALAASVVATEVAPDMERGPAWLPDSSRILFVKDARQDYNPLYLADLRTRTAVQVWSDTRMNHDVTCSPDGTIAFRAQVDQWDQIFVMRLKE